MPSSIGPLSVVMWNGRDGQATGALPGKLIRGPQLMPNETLSGAAEEY